MSDGSEADLREGARLKAGETLVVIAPKDMTVDDAALALKQGGHCGPIVVLPHSWATLPVDELRRAIRQIGADGWTRSVLTKEERELVDGTRAAANAATGGPWAARSEKEGVRLNQSVIVDAVPGEPGSWVSCVVGASPNRVFCFEYRPKLEDVLFAVRARAATVPLCDLAERLAAEVEQLEAEAEALRKRVRILEIAPFAAEHACITVKRPLTASSVDTAAHVIGEPKAFTEWGQHVRTYAAGVGGADLLGEDMGSKKGALTE